MTEHLPDEITYGFVADRVLLAVGDTTDDPDRFPDGVPAKGTVKFSPERTVLYTQDHPATVLPQDIECTIYQGDPDDWEGTEDPDKIGLLVDPAGHVGNVALIVGWYVAVYRLETGTAQRFRFKVLPEHTNDNPLWLPSVAPLTPTPSERFVVNEQVYNETLAAHDRTITYREAAKGYRNETLAARDLVLPARDQTLAARDATLAHGITVDTSVGTRVFVGDTMIYGDTGWRDVRDQLQNGWTAGTFNIRRIDSTVYIQAGEVSNTDATSNFVLTLPSGFRTGSANAQAMGIFQFSSLFTNAVLCGVRGGSGGSMFRIELGDESPSIGGQMSFNTPNSWPTSLPGTPA